jgi:F1F0 ATPase subunit 2
MTSEPAYLLLAGIQGALLGAVFFGGLWWTVRRAVTSRQPALWFLGSLAIRTLVVVAGFWFSSHGDWRRLTACMVGFVVSRIVVLRVTETRAKSATPRLTKGEI